MGENALLVNSSTKQWAKHIQGNMEKSQVNHKKSINKEMAVVSEARYNDIGNWEHGVGKNRMDLWYGNTR